MALLVGIDEAGYGPILGPLVVSGVAFRVSDDTADRCLWDRLSACISRRPGRRDVRLPICDSKKLYSSTKGLAALERTALVMAAVNGVPTDSVRRFLGALAPEALNESAGYPWYRDFDAPLPLVADGGGVPLATNTVRRDMEAAGVEPVGVFVEPLLERRFNDRVAKMRNKANVSFGLVLRIAHRFARETGETSIRLRVDRQGGRLHYRAPLATAFDVDDLHIEAETPERSAYRLHSGGKELRFEFIASGEEADMSVALASIVSKYVRELFMTALNRYWGERIEGLKPTAGYYQDGRRFLKDIGPVLESERLDHALLVRSR